MLISPATSVLLNDEITVGINANRRCRFPFVKTDDGNRLSEKMNERAVAVNQSIGLTSRDEIAARLHVIEKRCCQRVAADGMRGEVLQTACNICDFRRKTASRCADIETNADNDIGQLTGFRLDGGLGQNTAQLFAVHEYVIDPFDVRRKAGSFLNCLAGGDGGADRHQMHAFQRDVGAQQQTDIDAAAGRRYKAPSQSAAAGGLAVCDDGISMGQVCGALLEIIVGRIHRGQHTQMLCGVPGCQIHRNAGVRQGITRFIQAIASAGC